MRLFLWLLGLVLFFACAEKSAFAMPEAYEVLPPPPPVPQPATIPTLDPAPDLSSFDGKTVEHVGIRLEFDPFRDVTVPKVRALREGDPFSAEAARRGLLELMAHAELARGKVTVSGAGDGVVVTFHVVPRKVVHSLRLDLGHAEVGNDEALRELELSEGAELVGSELRAKRARLERLLGLHGYPEAEVEFTLRKTDDNLSRVVLIRARPGAPRTIRRRAFYVLGADEGPLRPLISRYELEEGARADYPAMDRADQVLRKLLRSKGYHRAEVSHDLVRSRGEVVLRVRVDAGPAYSVRFVGNDHYDEDALLGALSLEEEEDLSGSHLVDKVRTFYQKRGFLDAEVVQETRISADEKLAELVFYIHERTRVLVEERRFACLRASEIERLEGGGPRTLSELTTEIQSFLEEDLPGADLFQSPRGRGLDETVAKGPHGATGARPEGLDLDPESTLFRATMDRALAHVQELYRNEGYLHALVGPFVPLRAYCDPKRKGCVPLPIPPLPENLCAADKTNLPLPIPELDARYTCKPDPKRKVSCAPSVTLLIPVKLGPRTSLYDVAVKGLTVFSERQIADAARYPLGAPVNLLHLDEVRRRILEAYREEGYAYADVTSKLEPSADHTRARVVFDIQEGQQVLIRDIVIRGSVRTNESIVRRRVALHVGSPYRTSEIRKTEERIATLGVFTSVQVSLEEPYIPQAQKTVVITVDERIPQYIEPRVGFATGEGMRAGVEYGHRNIFGTAVSATFRAQGSYIPDALVIEDDVRANLRQLERDRGLSARVARRITLSVGIPEVGLGPVVRGQVDMVVLHHLARDFTLGKRSMFPALSFRPVREVQLTGGVSLENNDIALFKFKEVSDFRQSLIAQGTYNNDFDRVLRLPTGESIAIAPRVTLAWDRRDNALSAKRGTYTLTGAEFVTTDWIGDVPVSSQFQGQFVRLTQTVSGYLPLSRKVTIAGTLRVGQNVQLTRTSQTYPDRLFFLGGFDSMRGFPQDSFVPQDIADRIAADAGKPDCVANDPACDKFTISKVGLRGGNLLINPRVELRFPVKAPIDSVLFFDMGNVWVDPSYVTDRSFTLRSTMGSGVRWQTPVGPLVLDGGLNLSRLLSKASDPRRRYEDVAAFHFAIGLF